MRRSDQLMECLKTHSLFNIPSAFTVNPIPQKLILTESKPISIFFIIYLFIFLCLYLYVCHVHEHMPLCVCVHVRVYLFTSVCLGVGHRKTCCSLFFPSPMNSRSLAKVTRPSNDGLYKVSHLRASTATSLKGRNFEIL